MKNFWQQLKKPFFCLAPMDEVSDCAFREMVAKYSKYHPLAPSYVKRGNNFVMFTEFVSVDGLLHPDGQKRLLRDLRFTQKQRPIVAQLWGSDPKKFYQAAKIIKKLKFDGIDINMGCPKSREIALGGGAALILKPKLAQEIILQTKKGAGKLPVSVKTRLGYHRNIIKDWIKALLQAKPAAIIVHGRTKKEMSKVPAHWDAIAEAVKIRNQMFPLNPYPSSSLKGRGENGGLPPSLKLRRASRPLIIGNGDVKNYQDGITKAETSGVDGVMIGRASIGNPWVFKGDDYQLSIKDKLEALLMHTQLFEKWHKGKKSFATIRKHFKAYASGFDGAKELRAKLMEAEEAGEIRKIIKNHPPLKVRGGRG